VRGSGANSFASIPWENHTHHLDAHVSELLGEFDGGAISRFVSSYAM
jgi:hypothetical protein